MSLNAYDYNPQVMQVGAAQGVPTTNPMVPVPAQDPFGYTSGQSLPTIPGVNAMISLMTNFGLPDPSTGSRAGGMATAVVPGGSPQTDFYQGIVGNWMLDTMGAAPRIPTSPDYASSGRMGE
jgi:hypothetical protein